MMYETAALPPAAARLVPQVSALRPSPALDAMEAGYDYAFRKGLIER